MKKKVLSLSQYLKKLRNSFKKRNHLQDNSVSELIQTISTFMKELRALKKELKRSIPRGEEMDAIRAFEEIFMVVQFVSMRHDDDIGRINPGWFEKTLQHARITEDRDGLILNENALEDMKSSEEPTVYIKDIVCGANSLIQALTSLHAEAKKAKKNKVQATTPEMELVEA